LQELSKASKDLAKVKKELAELAETLERLNIDLKARSFLKKHPFKFGQFKVFLKILSNTFL
jgi:hypothetical protein